MEKMDQEIDFKEYAQYAGLIFAGTNSVARLMRAQRALSGESDGSLNDAIAQALDELGKKWDVEL